MAVLAPMLNQCAAAFVVLMILGPAQIPKSGTGAAVFVREFLSQSPNQQLELPRPTERGIEGLIRRADTRAPLSGVLIMLTSNADSGASAGGSQLTTLTDDSGRFSFRNLNPKQYLIGIRVNDYFPADLAAWDLGTATRPTVT